MRITACLAVLCAATLAPLGARAAEEGQTAFEGTVEAYHKAMINAKVSANVVSIPVRKGQEVEEGAILARLDDSVARAQYEIAVLQSSDDTAVREAELQLGQAKHELDTQTQLADKGAGVENERVKAKYNYDVAEVVLANRKSQFEQYKALARQREAELEQYNIRAPFKGVVADIVTEVGENTYPADRQLFQIIDISKVYITVPLDVRYIGALREGQEAHVTSENCPGKTFAGKVCFVSPTTELGGRQFIVRILVDNPDSILKPGITAAAAFAGISRDVPPAAAAPAPAAK